MKPISPSEFWVWENNIDKYYEQYILGIKEPQSREMLLGTIIHSGFEGKDWLKLLKENNFTADYERTVGEIMKFNLPKFPEKEVWLGKYGEVYEDVGCTLSGRADGRDKEKHIILEIKTGKNFWTQERADESDQITHYSFLHWKEFGQIPDNLLVSCNVSNGKVKMFNTRRSEQRINAYLLELKAMVEDLKHREWFDKRVSSYV